MKRYHFALEPVLRIRRVEEERAKERLQQANVALRRAITRRDDCAERHAASSAHSDASTRGDLDEERRVTDLALEALARAEAVVATAASEAALAHIAHREAAARVEMLERLEQRKRLEYTTAEQHEQAGLLDDLATIAVIRRRTEAANRGSS